MAECLAEVGATACAQCHNDDIVMSTRGEFAFAALCPHLQSCAACKGSGYRLGRDAEGYEVMRPCGRLNILTRVQRINAAGVPARYAHLRLDTLTPPTGVEQADAFILARNHVQRVARELATARTGTVGLGLSGPPGVGKTHLMCAMALQLAADAGLSVKYTDFSTLLWNLKAGFDRGVGENELLGPLLEADLLIIDEVGKGRATEWELTILDALVAGRYNRKKTVVFATNFPFEDPLTRKGQDPDAHLRWGFATHALAGDAKPESAPAEDRGPRVESLRDRVHDRVLSRLFEMCDFVSVFGEDLRKAGARERQKRSPG